jgi:23S rRNA pseudouridine2604 synthase
LIEQGRVTINGIKPEMGTKVTAGRHVVMVDGKASRRLKNNPLYIAFNKPVGIVCTTDVENEKK